MVKIFILMIVGLSILLSMTVDYATGDDLIVLGKGHAPTYIANSDSGRFDFSNDGLADYYVKAHYTGNENQMYKVDYKIQDECVDGDSFEEATMKLGFTNLEPYYYNRIWINDGIEAWTPWFKSDTNQDDNGLINLVYLSQGSIPSPYPSSSNGDDVIQGIVNKKQGSFTHKESIKELDNQAGWEGSIFFNASAKEYFMWTIHPATGINGCDTLAAFGIPIIIEE